MFKDKKIVPIMLCSAIFALGIFIGCSSKGTSFFFPSNASAANVKPVESSWTEEIPDRFPEKENGTNVAVQEAKPSVSQPDKDNNVPTVSTESNNEPTDASPVIPEMDEKDASITNQEIDIVDSVAEEQDELDIIESYPEEYAYVDDVEVEEEDEITEMVNPVTSDNLAEAMPLPAIPHNAVNPATVIDANNVRNNVTSEAVANVPVPVLVSRGRGNRPNSISVLNAKTDSNAHRVTLDSKEICRNEYLSMLNDDTMNKEQRSNSKEAVSDKRNETLHPITTNNPSNTSKINDAPSVKRPSKGGETYRDINSSKDNHIDAKEGVNEKAKDSKKGNGNAVVSVQDQQGKPVANAKVLLSNDKKAVMETTDSKGNASFNAVPADDYDALVVSSKGLGTESVSVNADATSQTTINIGSFSSSSGAFGGSVSNSTSANVPSVGVPVAAW